MFLVSWELTIDRELNSRSLFACLSLCYDCLGASLQAYLKFDFGRRDNGANKKIRVERQRVINGYDSVDRSPIETD